MQNNKEKVIVIHSDKIKYFLIKNKNENLYIWENKDYIEPPILYHRIPTIYVDNYYNQGIDYQYNIETLKALTDVKNGKNIFFLSDKDVLLYKTIISKEATYNVA